MYLTQLFPLSSALRSSAEMGVSSPSPVKFLAMLNIEHV